MIMSEVNCSSKNISSVEEVESKLKQYMLINKQISRTLTTQRIEIDNLKNSLRISVADGISLQVECHKWMKKFFTIREMFIAQIRTLTGDLQIHAETINKLSEDDECCSLLVDQMVAAPTRSAPRNADESRRVSKSFQLTKNRSQRRIDESLSMHTIEEDEEDESRAEELQEDGDARGIESSTNNSESKSEKSGQTCKEKILEKYMDTIRKIVESSSETGNLHEESDESSQESDESDEESVGGAEESVGGAEESVEGDEESVEGDEESGESDKEHDESDGESEASGQESDVSDSESEVDGDSVVASEAENNSHSVEQVSILTTKDESTIKDDDSNKENDTANGSISTRSISKNNSQSVISVDSDTSSKNTPVKPLNKLPVNKKNVNVHDQSVNLTYEKMEEQSLLSSTPYRSSNVDSGVSVDTVVSAKPSRSESSESSNANTLTASQISTSSSFASTRPKRKAAPVILLEPKLNTKLRRPR